MRDSGRRGAGGGALSRLPLASWRLFLASCAILAVGNTATALDLWWEGFGQQVVVAVALVYFALAWVGLAWPARSWPWLRGALATSLLLATASHLFEGGSLTSAWAPLVHAVVPALVVADYLAVGRSAGKWWWPLTWTLLPLAYLVYYASAGLLFYEFLDPVDSSYQVAVLGFLLADAAIGFVLFGLAGGRQSTYDHDISLSGR